jgi:hypothetical protein
MSAMHLIRFPSKKEHKRAIMALLEVPRAESLGLPVHALEHAKVPFTYLSKTAANGKISTPIQS